MACRLLSVVLLLACAACKDRPSKLVPPAPGEIARAGAMKLDGELDEPAWNATATRGVFLGDDGKLARPYSEIRLLADADTLYVALYAADEDIESRDAFALQLGSLALTASADGKVTAGTAAIERCGSAARSTPERECSAIDRDGTLDKPGDDDEEWVIELAVPRAQLGVDPAAPLAITARRCDTPKDGVARCGQWSATLALSPRR